MRSVPGTRCVAPLPLPRLTLFRIVAQTVLIVLSPAVNALAFVASCPFRLARACKLTRGTRSPPERRRLSSATASPVIEESFTSTLPSALLSSTRAWYKTLWVNNNHTEAIVFPAIVSKAPNRILYIIPGNPGAASFYSEFAESVWTQYGGTLSVVIGSHVGHSKVPNHDPSHSPSLAEQVAHHTAVVEALLTESITAGITNSKASNAPTVLLAGHSVGAYICLQVMKQFPGGPESPLRGSILLFPTFTFIGYTVNGLSLWPIFRYFRTAVYSVTLIAQHMPAWVQASVLRLAVGVSVWNDSPHVRAALTHLLDCTVAKNALFMANDEMQQILEPPIDFITEHQARLAFIYGAKDDWVHVGECGRVRDAFPVAHVVQTLSGKHAFVLDSDHTVGTDTVKAMGSHFGWRP